MYIMVLYMCKEKYTKVRFLLCREQQTTEIAQAQVTEALLRMKKLKIHENALKEFKESGKLNKSENFHLNGDGESRIAILYWLDEKEEKMVRDWEKETGNMVYHVIKNKMVFGLCYSFLYVSQETEEWEHDNEDMKQGYQLVYVKNVDDEYCSEYGSIGIKPMWGGVLRTA